MNRQPVLWLAAAQRVAATLVCGSLVPVSADLVEEKPGLPGLCITGAGSLGGPAAL